MLTKRTRPRFVLWHGVIGGIVAAMTFMVFQMTAAAAHEGSAFIPPRVLASLIFGEQALTATVPLLTALAVGMVVHVVLSILFGLAFVGLLTVFRQLCSSWRMMLVYGSLFGFALWIVNFRIIGSILFPQLLTVDQFWMGFLPHAAIIGLGLAVYVSLVRYAPRGVFNPSYRVCYVGTSV